VIFEDIDRLAGMDDKSSVEVLDRIGKFHSKRFKQNALTAYIDRLPQTRRPAVLEKLQSLAADQPQIIAQHEWLESVASNNLLTDMRSILGESRLLARRTKCQEARNTLQKAIVLSDGKGFEETMAVATFVEGCFRRRGAKERRNFWKSVEKPLETAYGFNGFARARMRVGYLHWTVDEFAEAKAIFKDVIEKAKKEQAPIVEAEAEYTLARIAENEGDVKLAISLHSGYAQQFPKAEHVLDSYQSLVLLHLDNRDPQSALGAAEMIVKTQSELGVDQRAIGPLAFGLFWAGRLHLQLGNRPIAEEMWRRVAAEYYSTYYGALGHFMLEQMQAKMLFLEPSRTAGLRLHDMRAAFDADGQETVRRAELLLRLGLRESAYCEITEIDTAGVPQRMALVALLLHATGEWLEAIKLYDSIPRSYRNSLAVGFERILFPKRHDEMIREFSKHVGIDSDLVMAVIRQESVFDKMARSGVGALGLMQLMPATARMEAKRVSKSGYPESLKAEVKRKMQSKHSLFDVELNLALGIQHLQSLIQEYQLPVYALTSYNASPRATKRWLESIPTTDVLSFIERIPYDETRNYVKLILRNYFYYKRWYSGPEQKLTHLFTVTDRVFAQPKVKTGFSAE
jgi:tetratricopeptide (TPR) repeat protein